MIVSDEVQFGKNAFTLGNYCDIMDMRNKVAIWFYDKTDSLIVTIILTSGNACGD